MPISTARLSIAEGCVSVTKGHRYAWHVSDDLSIAHIWQQMGQGQGQDQDQDQDQYQNQANQ